jgi:hypothetical protein
VPLFITQPCQPALAARDADQTCGMKQLDVRFEQSGGRSIPLLRRRPRTGLDQAGSTPELDGKGPITINAASIPNSPTMAVPAPISAGRGRQFLDFLDNFIPRLCR